jgi:hypothetical protein
VLDGVGRIRIDDKPMTLERLYAVLVEADSVRQVFNDGTATQLWLVIGAPPELANTLEMTAERLSFLYPDGPKALPPELGATEAS